jgi:hypothetical protein
MLVIFCIILSFISVVKSSDKEADVCNDSQHLSSLAQARLLEVPQAMATNNAEYENETFYNEHGSLIKEAWKEWEMIHATTLSDFNDEGWMEASLASSIDGAFLDPSEESEAAVKSKWTDMTNLPKGVYATQLLTQTGISYIRNLFDHAGASGIPTRRPNGMNRNGVIVDKDVFGAVPLEPLVKVVEEIIDRIARPVGRLLFPDRIGCDDDIDYYAFTIQYDGSESETNDNVKDKELKEHRDASVVTCNINLNLPSEGYEGSEVFFRGYPSADGYGTDLFEVENDEENNGGIVKFTPGMAIIHLGAHRHGSLPITAEHFKSDRGEQVVGKRFNLVIWLFGKNGDVRIAPYTKMEQLTATERWRGCNTGE